MHKAIAIVGPTASGKSDLAVEIALSVSGEVVSADSRQIYKGLDIGTGKITEKEKGGVPHHLLDIRDPLERYSVVEFQRDAFGAMQDITSRGNIPILCGGTGYFVSSVTDNIVFPPVGSNEALRKELENIELDELKNMLTKLDPNAAESIDLNNKRRVVRAIEIAKEMGEVPKLTKRREKYHFLKIGLSLPLHDLKEKIRIRLDKRLEAGLIEESEKLLKAGKLTLERMHELGLEYKYSALLLEGSLTQDEFREKLLIASGQYAKRQMTWFKRDLGIEWFHPIHQKQEIFEMVENFLERE